MGTGTDRVAEMVDPHTSGTLVPLPMFTGREDGRLSTLPVLTARVHATAKTRHA